MEDAEIERRFHLLQTEIESTGSVLSDLKVDWLAAMNSLRIEVETLKSHLDHYHPSFGENYTALRQEAIQSLDDEWIVIKVRRKE